MLTVNEQSELDILLTVEEPNDWMKNRIKELKEKQSSNEPLNQDEEACNCLGCRLAKCTTPEEHTRTVFDYMLTNEKNISKYVQDNGNLTDEEIDSLMKVFQPERQLTEDWRLWAFKEFCENIDENSEAYKMFEADAPKKVSTTQLELMFFCEGLLRESFSALAMSKSRFSFKGFFEGIFIKNLMLATVILARKTNLEITDRNLIGALLLNAISYLKSIDNEIFHPVNMITKPIVGVL